MQHSIGVVGAGEQHTDLSMHVHNIQESSADISRNAASCRRQSDVPMILHHILSLGSRKMITLPHRGSPTSIPIIQPPAKHVCRLRSHGVVRNRKPAARNVVGWLSFSHGHACIEREIAPCGV